jgi:hypothetical protein
MVIRQLAREARPNQRLQRTSAAQTSFAPRTPLIRGGTMTTTMSENAKHLLAWAFGLLFAASLVIYGVGVYYIQTQLYKHIGQSISMECSEIVEPKL